MSKSPPGIKCVSAFTAEELSRDLCPGRVSLKTHQGSEQVFHLAPGCGVAAHRLLQSEPIYSKFHHNSLLTSSEVFKACSASTSRGGALVSDALRSIDKTANICSCC